MPKFGVLREYCARRRAQKVGVTSRVQGWCTARVRWCTGSGCLEIRLGLALRGVLHW